MSDTPAIVVGHPALDELLQLAEDALLAAMGVPANLHQKARSSAVDSRILSLHLERKLRRERIAQKIERLQNLLQNGDQSND